MKVIAFIFIITGFILKPTCLQGQTADTLLLINGQILIGELKGMALGKVDFEDRDLDVATIKFSKIKTISASTNIYRLETIFHKIYYTHLRPGNNGSIYVLIDESWEELRLDQIGSLIPLHGTSGALWAGNVASGYSYTRSSGIGRFNADMSIKYTARKIEILGKGSLITTRTDSTYDFEYASSSIFFSYLFNPRWRGIALFNYQHNLNLGLARRYQQGFAAGFTLISSTKTQGKIVAGLVLSEEKSIKGEITPLQIEVPIIFIFDFYRFHKPDMTLNMTQSVYLGITQAGRFRQDGQLSLNWKIISNFSVNVQVYDNFDNKPLGVNSRKLDFGIVFGLSYRFSQ